MTDYLTPELLDALEAEFSAEREHRKQSWLERSICNFEIAKFRDKIRLSEKRDRTAHNTFRKQQASHFLNLRKILISHRKQTWEEIVQDFCRQYAQIPKDDEEAQQKFILKLYRSYYFSPSLIGRIVGQTPNSIWSWLEEWTYENEQMKG